MKYFMNKFTSLDTPMLITLNDNTGKVLKTLVTNDKLKQKLAEYAIPQKEFFTFKTTEGVDLNGWMMKPVNFDPAKRYPVLMFQYSGSGFATGSGQWGNQLGNLHGEPRLRGSLCRWSRHRWPWQ